MPLQVWHSSVRNFVKSFFGKSEGTGINLLSPCPMQSGQRFLWDILRFPLHVTAAGLVFSVGYILEVLAPTIKRLMIFMINVEARRTIGQHPVKIDLFAVDVGAGIGLPGVAPFAAADVRVPVKPAHDIPDILVNDGNKTFGQNKNGIGAFADWGLLHSLSLPSILISVPSGNMALMTV